MSIKIFKISYCSFTFKLKEKKEVPLEGVGNISKKGGFDKKGVKKKERRGDYDPQRNVVGLQTVFSS